MRELADTSGFKLDYKMKYLGVTLTNKGSSIMADNYLKLLKEIHEVIEIWQSLQL